MFRQRMKVWKGLNWINVILMFVSIQKMISIIVPAHNEKKNIVFLINDLLKLKLKKEIIISNDHSTDGTRKIVEKMMKKHKEIRILNRNNGIKGMGFTLADGTKIAKYPYVVWVMGDRSDDLNTIYDMVEKLDQGYDVVFGSRYIRGGSIGDNSKFKALMSGGYSFVANLLFHTGVHDIGNAFRAFKKEVFNRLKIERGDFSISPEMAIKAHLAGFKLGEVPTTYKKRKEGMSKFKLFNMGIRDVSLFKLFFVNPKKL